MNRFTVWRREMLGLHPTVEEFRAALERGGNRINNLYAGEIFAKTPLATERTTVSLFRATGRDLGLTRYYAFTKLLAAAAKHGLGKLPAEAGPALREAYTNQPKGETVWICTDPVVGSDGFPLIWSVAHDDGVRQLRAYYVGVMRGWSPETVWVFGQG